VNHSKHRYPTKRCVFIQHAFYLYLSTSDNLNSYPLNVFISLLSS
jgi:hypothetical protein